MSSEIELLQYEIDIIFDGFDEYTILLEESNAVVIDIIVWLVVFFYSDIHLALIDDLCIFHMLVDKIFEDFSCFFSQVQEILIIAIP